MDGEERRRLQGAVEGGGLMPGGTKYASSWQAYDFRFRVGLGVLKKIHFKKKSHEPMKTRSRHGQGMGCWIWNCGDEVRVVL